MNDFFISAEITYCPSNGRLDGGWCWEVRVNGKMIAEEILPETSRITAEAKVAKYLMEAMGYEKDVSNDPR